MARADAARRAAPPQCDDAEPLSLRCAPAVDADADGAATYSAPPDATAAGLLALWQHGKLCDVVLEGADGAELPAHRLVLAATSGFFRALFTVGAL